VVRDVVAGRLVERAEKEFLVVDENTWALVGRCLR